MKTFLRVLIIGAILVILVFLSIGIVRVVPKALSSLASATVSLGSIFGGSNSDANQVNTGANNGANTNTGSNTNGNTNGNDTVVTGNGFIISSSTSSTGASSGASTGVSTSTSLTDIITAKFGSYGQNNYVPNPGTNTSNYNYSTGAYSTSKSNSNTSSSVSASTASACANSGYSDLAVEIISKGIIDRNTGQFIATNSFSTSDIVSIKFKVENRGVCPTGTWNIRVQMPSSNSADQLKELKGNASIPAGAALVGQANFDSPVTNNPIFSVTVSDNNGRDANTSNNISSATLNVVNTGGNSGGSTGIVVIGDGRADLVVRILQTGILSYNNTFIPQSNTSVFRTGDRLAVRFEIINQGKSSTGPWTFKADLSGASNQQYQNSQYEASIPSGGKATYTMGFNGATAGNNYLTIYADNTNQVNEFDEGNNNANANFYVSY